MTEMDRHLRQRRVKEIGDQGQALLCATTVVLPQSAKADLTALYLERAGLIIQRVDGPAPAPDRFPHGQFFRNEATRAVAAASWEALNEVRRALHWAAR